MATGGLAVGYVTKSLGSLVKNMIFCLSLALTCIIDIVILKKKFYQSEIIGCIVIISS
ncbi:MAG: hypothetical protein MHPSP_002052, partial [Paramarteilia canceri]